jgi:hypothetical protein
MANAAVKLVLAAPRARGPRQGSEDRPGTALPRVGERVVARPGQRLRRSQKSALGPRPEGRRISAQDRIPRAAPRPGRPAIGRGARRGRARLRFPAGLRPAHAAGPAPIARGRAGLPWPFPDRPPPMVTPRFAPRSKDGAAPAPRALPLLALGSRRRGRARRSLSSDLPRGGAVR